MKYIIATILLISFNTNIAPSANHYNQALTKNQKIMLANNQIEYCKHINSKKCLEDSVFNYLKIQNFN